MRIQRWGALGARLLLISAGALVWAVVATYMSLQLSDVKLGLFGEEPQWTPRVPTAWAVTVLAYGLWLIAAGALVAAIVVLLGALGPLVGRIVGRNEPSDAPAGQSS